MKNCTCGASLSENATKCPKCGARVRQNTEKFKCRICDSELYLEDHYYSYSSSSIVNGSTTYHTDWAQRACNNCGEPKPVPEDVLIGQQLKNRPFFWLFILVMILFILLVSFKR